MQHVDCAACTTGLRAVRSVYRNFLYPTTAPHTAPRVSLPVLFPNSRYPHCTSQWLRDLSSSLGKATPPPHIPDYDISLTAPSGTGYIGSFTALALLEAGYKVVIVDNLYNSSKEVINRIELICGKKPAFYQLDIQDEAALDKVFKEHPDIDNVIHFAALKVREPQLPRKSAC
jgi:hypothetical protein